MRIITKGDGYHVRLRIPTGLVFNRFTAAAVSKEMGKYGVKLSPGQARILMKELKKYRRTHPDWVLAEVHSSDGDYVLVKL